MISASSTVRVDDAGTGCWASLYQGWAEAPVEWPGRTDAVEGLTGTSVSITGPSNAASLSGEVTVTARAASAYDLQVTALYADYPRDPSPRARHSIGNAVRRNGGWAMQLNTIVILDQGGADLGTVLIRATALDAKRKPKPDSDSDSWRYVVDDGTAAALAAENLWPPGPRRETAGVAANTWTDYAASGGTADPVIEVGATVDVTCRVQGQAVTNHNRWWYRIAAAFYNDGQTSGGLEGTPMVDTHIQRC